MQRASCKAPAPHFAPAQGDVIERTPTPSYQKQLIGDRVIIKNTQYTSKTCKGKFQCAHGKVREYLVKSVNQGIVSLEELGTGAIVMKHESQCKVMPKALPPDDSVDLTAINVLASQDCRELSGGKAAEPCKTCADSSFPNCYCNRGPTLSRGDWDTVDVMMVRACTVPWGWDQLCAQGIQGPSLTMAIAA